LITTATPPPTSNQQRLRDIFLSDFNTFTIPSTQPTPIPLSKAVKLDYTTNLPRESQSIKIKVGTTSI